MNKSTRTIGIDSKAGRKSRTGSTVTMGITDLEAIECQQYFMAIEAGEEPTGRIKKIELVMYDDKEELETIESLKAEIKELKWCIESIDKVVENTEILDKAIENSDQPLIEDIIIEQDSEENEHLPASQLDLDIYEEVKE